MTSDADRAAIQGVAGVIIWTDDLPRMLRFYRDTLGLTPLHERPAFVNFQWGDFRLSVGVHDDVSGANADPLRIMLNLDVADIEAVHARLRAAGIAFSRPPEPEPWGGIVATFQDPDGNTLQLMQLPD